MKLPSLVQQPVGEYALGNIQQPNYQRVGQAAQDLIDDGINLIDAMQGEADVAAVDEATGTAAQEISKLRAKLINENMINTEDIPEGIKYTDEMLVPDESGERDAVTTPQIFTHEVSEQMWDTGVEEILSHHASTIPNADARAKWMTEMIERYVAPGTLAVAKANAARSKAYGQAQAERAIEGIIASDAPREIRENQAKEVIARQFILGQNPVWVENQLQALGPAIDQMDVQNEIIAATSIDQIDQIEERMWQGGTRMGPEQLRTMSVQMDRRRADFEKERKDYQTEYADQMYGALYRQELTIPQVGAAVVGDHITNEDSQVMYNALTKGSTAKASDPFVLSRYQAAIQVIQYTGNQALVLQRQKLLRLTISRAAMGLNPNGTPSGLPARITGADAFELNKQLDTAVTNALENNEYDNALRSLVAWTRVNVNLEGQIYAGIGGNQNTVDAAIAFKQGLDNYMNQFGADAKPQEYFDANKDAFNPNNFAEGINKEFRDQVPQSASYMTKAPEMEGFFFTEASQTLFENWLGDNAATMDPAELRRIQTLFDQYYRGRGIAPAGGRLLLEPNDPLYDQFEALIQ